MTLIKTETGTLLDGVPFEGRLHVDFEIRLPVMQHTGQALDDTEERFGTVEGFAADAYYRCAVMACSLVRLGDIPQEALTAALLHENLTSDDYDILLAARESLKGKRSGEKPGSPVSNSPSLPSADTASAKSE